MRERKAVICYMLGWIEGVKKPIKRQDALILLDNILIDMCQPVLRVEEKVEFLQDINDEMSFGLLQMGINSKKAKEIARTGKFP